MSCVVCVPFGDAYNATHSRVEVTGVACTPCGACKLHLWFPLGIVLRCMRPHWARTQRETFQDGIRRYNLHGPMGRASYTWEFHRGVHCVVYVPIGGGYNATHSQVEFTGVTCTPRGGVQVIPVNSTWECVALYPPPMGTYTTQCIPRGNFMGATMGVEKQHFLVLWQISHTACFLTRRVWN